MTKSLFLSGALALSTASFAQITLNHSGYSGWTAADNSIGYSMTFPAAAPGANATWDFSAIYFDDADSILNYTAGTNSSFPGADFYHEIHYVLNSQISLKANVWNDLANAGLEWKGEKIERQAYSLSQLTGNTSDSLVFPEQTVVYSSPRKLISFPATAGTTWTSTYNYSQNFNLTALFFNNTPGSRKSYTTETYNVAGWGKLRTRDENGNITGYMDVLQVLTHQHIIDSFFLNNAPADSVILDAFNLQQGQSRDYYYVSWYRAGEITPLVEAEYTDDNYQTSLGAFAHMERLAPTSVHDLSLQEQIGLYPNPNTGRSFALTLPATTGSWHYQLLSLTGQKVAGAPMTLNGTAASVTVPAGTAAGTYFVKVYQNNIAVAVKTLVLQ